MPLTEQYLLDLIAPPIGAVAWWILSRGWADLVQLGNVSDTTQRRQRKEFVILLIVFYVLMFGATTYFH